MHDIEIEFYPTPKVIEWKKKFNSIYLFILIDFFPFSLQISGRHTHTYSKLWKRIQLKAKTSMKLQNGYCNTSKYHAVHFDVLVVEFWPINLQ